MYNIKLKLIKMNVYVHACENRRGIKIRLFRCTF